jgi:hypothetical protein
MGGIVKKSNETREFRVEKNYEITYENLLYLYTILH